MIRNILEFLEQTTERFPDKTAFSGEKTELSFRELSLRAKRVGSCLAENGVYHKPVVIFMEKGPDNCAAMFGAVYGGNFYIIVDEEMPAFRIELILKTLEAEYMICDETTASLTEKFGYEGKVFLYEEMIRTEEAPALLAGIRAGHLDTDPLYVIFTSGSTGVPKGVLACHRSVIDYFERFVLTIGIDENSILANQAPFHFDASMKELAATIVAGSTTVIVPKQLFMFPVKLVEYLNAHRVNTLCWVASALSLVSSMKTFDKIRPEYVKTVTFVGEVFPVKQLKEWQKALPEARFFNVYGPTETTGVCCYYEVNREFDTEDTIPIGKPFANCGVFLLKEDGTEPSEGEIGEICVKGTCLTLGYYNDPERTAEVFVQNPLQNRYPERIYKTGDLAKMNAEGELVYVSRKDFQIKHMGHRIELGEIEVVAGAMDGIESVCCLFDPEKNKILFFYAGSAEKKETAAYLKEKLPRYMFPGGFFQLPRLPYSVNGKIDRAALKAAYEEMEK